MSGSATIDPVKAFGGQPNVKSPQARYSSKRYTGRHFKTGEQVVFGGSPVETPSELDFVKAGVLFKLLAKRALGPEFPSANEHEIELLKSMLADDLWCGDLGGQYVRGVRLPEKLHQKADLLTDSGSGGLYVVPAWFDAAIVSYPLLFGELFPFVNVIEVPASNRIEGATIGNPTATWSSNSDGTPLSAFNATDLVNQITASVKSCKVGLLVGNDLLADNVANLGQQLMAAIGQRFASELDTVIAVGDGTDEPEGIFTASGTTSVSSVNGTSGPASISDAEQLAFALPKQYRKPGMNCAFVGSDAMYRRFRAVPVGAADARRIFGMDHQSYQLLEYPFRVQNDIPEGSAAFVALAKYRAWRRSGINLRVTSEGQTLVLKNESLFHASMRIAGKLIDANACATCEDLPTTG